MIPDSGLFFGPPCVYLAPLAVWSKFWLLLPTIIDFTRYQLHNSECRDPFSDAQWIALCTAVNMVKVTHHFAMMPPLQPFRVSAPAAPLKPGRFGRRDRFLAKPELETERGGVGRRGVIRWWVDIDRSLWETVRTSPAAAAAAAIESSLGREKRRRHTTKLASVPLDTTADHQRRMLSLIDTRWRRRLRSFLSK